MWTVYLAKCLMSGFWEHGGDLCLYFVFKMQISFLNRRSSKQYSLCVYNVPSDFVSRCFSLDRSSSERLLYI